MMLLTIDDAIVWIFRQKLKITNNNMLGPTCILAYLLNVEIITSGSCIDEEPPDILVEHSGFNVFKCLSVKLVSLRDWRLSGSFLSIQYRETSIRRLNSQACPAKIISKINRIKNNVTKKCYCSEHCLIADAVLAGYEP